MLRRLLHLPADAWYWLTDHKLVAGAIVLCLAVGGGGAYLLTREDDGDDAARAPAPKVLVREVQAPEEPDELGFPAFATKNTTRVAGPDAITNAAGVALAVHPSTGGVDGPPAVSLVDAGDWPAAIAAASLAGPPVGAPILFTESEDVPELTANALGELDPQGSAATAGRQAFAIGGAPVPEDLEALEVGGNDAAEVAAEIDRLRERLAGKPEHIIVASSEQPEIAMPAAGWAARSGDPVLFVERSQVPEATREALERHKDTAVYVLGPDSVISAKAMNEIKRVAPGAQRVGTDDPVENAIEFARYASGSFGWNINDPGHGFVVASTERPADAAAAAPLSASGTWGPLLLSDDAETLPAPLRGYLLDLKPGYESDPTRAVYNHIWLIGDPQTLSVALQAQLDEIAEAVPVSSGSGADAAPPGPEPGTPESQPDEPKTDDGDEQRDDSN